MIHTSTNDKLEVSQFLVDAANRYLGLLMIYLNKTQTKFSPAITVGINGLAEMLHDNEPLPSIWAAFLELCKTAKNEGIDIMDLPTKVFGYSIY